MEIFGGFMVMMSIIGFFLAVVWLVMPFVVFAIKGKQDRTLDVLESIEKRLAVIEATMLTVVPEQEHHEPSASIDSGIELPDSVAIKNEVVPADAVIEKNSADASPTV